MAGFSALKTVRNAFFVHFLIVCLYLQQRLHFIGLETYSFTFVASPLRTNLVSRVCMWKEILMSYKLLVESACGNRFW